MLKLDANNRSIGGGLIVFRNVTACVLVTLPFGFALLMPLKNQNFCTFFPSYYINLPTPHNSHNSKSHSISPGKNLEVT